MNTRYNQDNKLEIHAESKSQPVSFNAVDKITQFNSIKATLNHTQSVVQYLLTGTSQTINKLQYDIILINSESVNQVEFDICKKALNQGLALVFN